MIDRNLVMAAFRRFHDHLQRTRGARQRGDPP